MDVKHELVPRFWEAYFLKAHTDCVEWLARYGTAYERRGSSLWTVFRHRNEGVKPCLCVHTDTVHPQKPDAVLLSKDGRIAAVPAGIKFDEGGRINLVDGISMIGLGADDRNGLIVAATLMSRDIAADVAVFDEEENGSVGARSLPEVEFEGVSIWVGLDYPGDSHWTDYERSTRKVDDIVARLLPSREKERGLISDCARLSDRSGRACINISVGDHRPHRPENYGTYQGMAKAVEDVELLVPALSGCEFMNDGTSSVPPARMRVT